MAVLLLSPEEATRLATIIAVYGDVDSDAQRASFLDTANLAAYRPAIQYTGISADEFATQLIPQLQTLSIRDNLPEPLLTGLIRHLASDSEDNPIRGQLDVQSDGSSIKTFLESLLTTSRISSIVPGIPYRWVSVNDLQGRVEYVPPLYQPSDIVARLEQWRVAQGVQEWATDFSLDQIAAQVSLYYFPYLVLSGEGEAQWSATYKVFQSVTEPCATCGGNGKRPPLGAAEENQRRREIADGLLQIARLKQEAAQAQQAADAATATLRTAEDKARTDHDKRTADLAPLEQQARQAQTDATQKAQGATELRQRIEALRTELQQRDTAHKAQQAADEAQAQAHQSGKTPGGHAPKGGQEEAAKQASDRAAKAQQIAEGERNKAELQQRIQQAETEMFQKRATADAAELQARSATAHFDAMKARLERDETGTRQTLETLRTTSKQKSDIAIKAARDVQEAESRHLQMQRTLDDAVRSDVPCPTCGGTGTLTKQVAVTESDQGTSVATVAPQLYPYFESTTVTPPAVVVQNGIAPEATTPALKILPLRTAVQGDAERTITTDIEAVLAQNATRDAALHRTPDRVTVESKRVTRWEAYTLLYPVYLGRYRYQNEEIEVFIDGKTGETRTKVPQAMIPRSPVSELVSRKGCGGQAVAALLVVGAVCIGALAKLIS